MPLADVTNAQQPPSRSKRFSLGSDISPRGENVAPSPYSSTAKETPPRLNRFLAPTKASAAKTTPPSLERTRAQPHSGRNPPSSQTQPSSRLPSRGGTLTIAPPTSKWSAPSSNRARFFAKPVQTRKSSPLSREVSDSEDRPSPSPSQSMPSIVQGKPATEKQLPARPVASLAYGPSPSKDGRTLIDAVERPLRLSVGGSEHDWPSLSPSPQSTPSLNQSCISLNMPPTEPQQVTPSARLSSTASNLLAAASELTRTMTSQHTERHQKISNSAGGGRCSSLSACASVSETTSKEKTELATPAAAHDDAHVSSPPQDTPPLYTTRTSSLRDRLSNGSLIECGPDSGNKVAGFTDFTRDVNLTSRPHSPSPASFSRPRPTSISHPSIAPPSAVVVATPTRTPRTASRIPMSDPKKATLVNIKSRRSSAIPLPKGDKGLSFGGRRINSPDPLKVLDHGIKRQQLRRANTNGSTSTASTVPTRILNGSTIDRSKTSSPDGTMGSSTDDEEEVTTPSDKSLHFVKHGYKPKHVNRVSAGHYAGATLKVYDEAEIVLGRPPPSNSPFTGPLQTIPSQSALPVDGASPIRTSCAAGIQPRVVIKPTEFPAFAERLSILQDTSKLSADDKVCGADLADDTRSELVNLLREAEHEDALISQCGAMGLDVETKREISRTLSMLEGRSGPPNIVVDPGQMSFMFGRLRSGFEKAPKSAAFVEDATLAERFLARQNSTVSEAAQQVIQAKANGQAFASPVDGKESVRSSQHSRSKTLASKWSDSTTSAKDSPPPLHGDRRYDYTTSWDGMVPGVSPKDEHGDHGSIGFPSRIPGVSSKAHRVLGASENSMTSQNVNARRISSPTLGSTVPGSIKAAHKRVMNAAGSMSSRATISSRSKQGKAPMSTPNTKAYGISNEMPRGRLPSAEKSEGRATVLKTPRSRSKSRYVLDKINGFFSNKRDRRNSEIPPPVPAIKERPGIYEQPTHQREQVASLGSPIAKSMRPLTKMPTVSPPVDPSHPALTSSTSLDTPVTRGNADYEGRHSLQTLSEKLVGRAQREGDPARKERLLNFAKVLNDSLISAREAQISAETAQTAARSAQLSYEMTMKSVAMLQRLASSMTRR